MTTTTAGTRRNRVAYVIIGIFVATCAIGWAIIMAHSEGTPGITAQVVSWRAADRSVRVHYEIAKLKGDDVHCTVVAYAPNHSEVGRTDVRVPPGTGDVDTRQDVPTSSRATSVDVEQCRTG